MIICFNFCSRESLILTLYDTTQYKIIILDFSIIISPLPYRFSLSAQKYQSCCSLLQSRPPSKRVKQGIVGDKSPPQNKLGCHSWNSGYSTCNSCSGHGKPQKSYNFSQNQDQRCEQLKQQSLCQRDGRLRR